MESITIIPKQKLTEIESEKELLGHLVFHRQLNSLLHSNLDWNQKSILVYSPVFSQMNIKWLKSLFLRRLVSSKSNNSAY